MLKPDHERILRPEDVAASILHVLTLPAGRAGERARHPAHEPLGAACPACSSPCASAGASRSPSCCPGPGRPGGTLGDLIRETGCGAGCGLCRPYLRRMLATGETVFRELLTEDAG